MSCLGKYYFPSVPRTWNRYENACAYIPQQDIEAYQGRKEIYFPYLKRSIPNVLVNYELEMIKKGNVLEHRHNKMNLTKKQRFAQLAHGVKLVKKTFAVQSETYTNPNVLSLKRNNFVGITQQGALTNDPITCPTIPVIPSGPILPPSLTKSSKNPILPPPPPPSPNKNPVIPPFALLPLPPPVVYPTGGTLQCNIIENICTGEILRTSSTQRLCYDTTCSDVPGPIMELCYNPTTAPNLIRRKKNIYQDGGINQL